MSSPRVVAVEPESPAARAGVLPGDEILSIDGDVPRDVIRWQLLTDEPNPSLTVRRGEEEFEALVAKAPGESLGVEVHAAIFDRVQTCDNHCEFCFIYQLPKGMRRSLYLKDDDYRLSFLYGNFTTLTRFTELDLERVVTERLSPLNVSIHATDPDVRADMLQNRRGAVSLRWLRALLDHDIEVHGQVVVCPGVNDGAILEDTLAGALERFPELASICVVPLGVSKYSKQDRMRPHTVEEAVRVVDIVADWQELYVEALARRVVFAADEYYLLAGRPFPPSEHYGDFAMHEDGIGMARTLEAEFHSAGQAAEQAAGQAAGQAANQSGQARRASESSEASEASQTTGPRAGFFAWVDGAPADGYRAPRVDSPASVVTAGPVGASPVSLLPRRNAPVGVLTGPLGAPIIEPLIGSLGRDDVRVVAVANEFFGGNVGVTGLMVGEDVARVLASEPDGHRYLLPDVCLSRGVFLDGLAVTDLPKPVEVIATDGSALRRALHTDEREAA